MGKSAFVCLGVFVTSGCVPVAGGKPNIANPEARIADAPQIVRSSTVFAYNHATQGNCTGVVVAGNRILFAKHCVQKAGQVVSDADQFEIFFGPDLQGSGLERRRGVGRVRALGETDLATLDFAGGLPAGFAPAPLYGPPTGDAPLTIAPGQEMVTVGYGAVAERNGKLVGDMRFIRWGVLTYVRWLPKMAPTDGETYTRIIEYKPGPKGSMVCGGDSGGPVFLENRGRWGLFAINSMSDEGCAGFGYAADVRPHVNWIVGN